MKVPRQNGISLVLILLYGFGLTSSCTKFSATVESPPEEIITNDTTIKYINGTWNFANCIIEKPSDTYPYPLTPYTPGWAMFTEIREIWQIDQLPDSVMKHISTVGLIETVLAFPYYTDYMLANSEQAGFDFFTRRFNGMQELYKRDSAASLVFERYKIMIPACIGDSFLYFTNFELLLAQYKILGKFDNRKLAEVAREALLKYDQRKAAGESGYDLQFIPVICGRILKIAKYQPFITALENNAFLDQYLEDLESSLDAKSTNLVLFHTEQFINGFQL